MKVLCVDDEPQVLEGLALTLRRKYEMISAASGAEALEILKKDPSIPVILSDMRMPVMDGAAFLAQSRGIAPHAVRMLLTGQTDLESAVKAVNDGQLFRFIAKPCPPQTLLAAVDAAMEQHRLLTAERVLLEETLLGSVRALAEVLSIANPTAYGRMHRLRQTVSAVAERLGLRERWAVEVAAMLSQLGQPVTNIPRLEPVHRILSLYENGDITSSDMNAHVLRAVNDLDTLESKGTDIATAIGLMNAKSGRYNADVMIALQGVREIAVARQVKEVNFMGLRSGMVLAADALTKDGRLLVARGFEVTVPFLERASKFAIKEPLVVYV